MRLVRLRRITVCAAAALVATPTFAEPPPGHLTPQQTRDLLMPDKPSQPEDLPNRGTVVQAIDANQFTYIEVRRGDATEWIAAPLMVVQPGASIRYEEGSVMGQFYSKLLKRTFERLMFVGDIQVEAP